MKHKTLGKVGSVGKTTNNSDSDFDVLPMFPLDKPNRLQVKETTFNTYDYKLFGEIKGVDDYFDLIDALNYASPDDEFIIRIHSGGGVTWYSRRNYQRHSEHPCSCSWIH